MTAIQQLQTLAGEIDVDFRVDASQAPLTIVDAALRQGEEKFVDDLLVDTAGRLAIDQQMMDEISAAPRLNPVETLFAGGCC